MVGGGASPCGIVVVNSRIGLYLIGLSASYCKGSLKSNEVHVKREHSRF